MKSRWLLVCGEIAGPLFIVTFVVDGLLRPDYSAIRDSVSALAIGQGGWLQSANFEMTGLLILLFAIGVRHYFGQVRGNITPAWLFIILAAGVMGSGLFKTDGSTGIRMAVVNVSIEHSLHGTLHVFFAVSAFLVLSFACFVFSRQFRIWHEAGWANYSFASGVGILAFLLFSATALERVRGLAGYEGLFERLSIIIGLGWLSLLARKLLRLTSARNDDI